MIRLSVEGADAGKFCMSARIAEYNVAASVVSHLEWVLENARKQYNFEIAFIIRFKGETAIVENLSVGASAADLGLVAGVSVPLNESFGTKVAEGLAPRYVADGRNEQFLARQPFLGDFPVASYVATPIFSRENGLLGVLVCASRTPRTNAMHVPLLAFEQFSRYAALDLDMLIGIERTDRDIRDMVSGVIKRKQFTQYFQPVVDQFSGGVLYFEGLTRLTELPGLDVPQLLALSQQVCMMTQLEIAFAEALKQAATKLDCDAKVGLNFSETTLLSDAFLRFLARYDHRNTIIELTEHCPVDQPDALRERVKLARKFGVKIALDDTGAGFSAIRNILVLEPEILKADKILVETLENTKVAQRLLAVLDRFCRESGSVMVVEGVERDSQLACLREIGVRYVQGYFIARPAKGELVSPRPVVELRKALP